MLGLRLPAPGWLRAAGDGCRKAVHLLGSASSTRGGAVGGFAGVGVGVGVGVSAGAGGAVGLVRSGRAGPEEMAAKAAAVIQEAAGGEGVWPGKPGPPILPWRQEAALRSCSKNRWQNDTKTTKLANEVTSPHLGRALWSPRATADVVCCSDV